MASAHIYTENDDGWDYYAIYANGVTREKQIYSTQSLADAEAALDLVDTWSKEEVDERDDFQDALDAFKKGELEQYEQQFASEG